LENQIAPLGRSVRASKREPNADDLIAYLEPIRQGTQRSATLASALHRKNHDAKTKISLPNDAAGWITHAIDTPSFSQYPPQTP
jgi:hypothetical protein